MKIISLVIMLLLVTFYASAEDALMNGGRSPNGKYEVRIVKVDAEPSDYAICVYTVAKESSPFTISGVGGHLIYKTATERNRAFWDPSSRFVAVTDQGTRHTVEIYLLAILPSGIERLSIPDYIQNALGRVDATSVDFACVTTPERWQGDDLVMSLYFTANNRRSYKCKITIHVTYEEHSYPRVILKSVSDIEEQEG